MVYVEQTKHAERINVPDRSEQSPFSPSSAARLHLPRDRQRSGQPAPGHGRPTPDDDLAGAGLGWAVDGRSVCAAATIIDAAVYRYHDRAFVPSIVIECASCNA